MDMAQMLRTGQNVGVDPNVGTGPTAPVDPQRMMAAQWDMIARKRQAGVPLTPEEEQAAAAGDAYKAQIGEPGAREAASAVGQMALPLKVQALQLLAPTPAGEGSFGRAEPGTNEEMTADAAAGDAARAANPSLGAMLRQGFGSLIGSAQAQTRPATGGVEADAVRALQQSLKASGHYTGPIDGVMGPGTHQAQQAKTAAEQASQGQSVQLAQAQAEAEKAKAAAAETERQRLAAEMDAQRKQQGDARMKEIDAGTSNMSKMLREYGPAAAAVGGAGLGMFLRGKVVGASNRASADTAKRGDDLMAGASTGPTSERVGKVNQFWAEGQAGSRGAPVEPFAINQSRAGFAANADVPAAGALYRPNRMNNAATDAAVPAAGMAESVIVDQTLGERARTSLAAAQEAVATDPSEANIQRLQDARNKVAVADSVSMAGRGVAMGYIGDMPIQRRAHARPQTAIADSERMSLGQMLRSGGGRGTPPPAPAPVAALAAPASHPAAAQPRIPAGKPNAGRWTKEQP